MTRIDMTTREWHELIKPVLPHASTDKDDPELAAIRIEPAEFAVYAVAFDRYTMAAERWPLPGSDRGYFDVPPIHVRAVDASASLKLFTYSKDDDPLLRVVIDRRPIPVHIAGEAVSFDRLAVTVESADGTRLVLHDTRDQTRDPLAGWRRSIRAAMRRPAGRALEGLDLSAEKLARWAAAARKGERLTFYTGPEPGDPLLVTVEKHFAGLWSVPRYLDGPGKTRDALPWWAEIAATLLDTDDTGPAGD